MNIQILLIRDREKERENREICKVVQDKEQIIWTITFSVINNQMFL